MIPHESQIRIGFDEAEAPQPLELEDESFRIVIVGDFGGGARSSAVPLADRAIRIDRDGVDAALAIIAPELRLVLDPAADPELLTFESLDDLHPDRLLQTVPLLNRLRSLREELMRPDDPSPTSSRTSAPPAELEAGGSLLDRILDQTHHDSAPASAGDDLPDIIRRAVRPHLAPQITEAQAGMVNQVDEAIVASLRVLLHQPAFQALEAAWRGADFFLRRCNAGSAARIAIADLSATELRAMLAADSSDSCRELLGSADGSPRWSLVLCTHAFRPADIGILARLATIAAATDTPWIVGATPRFVGAASFAADEDEWDTSPPAGWAALRESPHASRIGMALPGFLLRSAYGADTDAITTMPFEEFAEGRVPHDSFLWGSGVLLCGLIVSEEVERGEPRPSHGTIGGLPFHVAHIDGAAVANPCAETYMSQRMVMHLLDLGLTPLVSQHDTDAVRVPRVQSIAAPLAPLAFGKAGGS